MLRFPQMNRIVQEDSMRILGATARVGGPMATRIFAILLTMLAGASALLAQAPEEAAGGEANLKLPDLSSVYFLGINGHTLLLYGIVICVFGLIFGMTIFMRLKNMEVHSFDARDF